MCILTIFPRSSHVCMSFSSTPECPLKGYKGSKTEMCSVFNDGEEELESIFHETSKSSKSLKHFQELVSSKTSKLLSSKEIMY